MKLLCFLFRHGHQYGSQPVKIKDSQADWWKPEDWTLDAVRREVGEHTVYRDLKKCAPGQKNRETKNCHRIKEKEPKLLGVSWAAMVSVNAEKTGITTYNDLFDKQVCSFQLRNRAFIITRQIPIFFSFEAHIQQLQYNSPLMILLFLLCTDNQVPHSHVHRFA